MLKFRFKKQMHTPQGEEWLDVDTVIDKGEFVGLFGVSGAGKTTFLRILAGLTEPQEGHIEVDGKIWFDSRQGIDLPTQQRNIGFVFQENSLFPNMTVLGNLEYACAKKQGDKSIKEWLELMGLKGLEGQRSHQLSGGQKQRLALARALVGEPKILFLDEPLSDLDGPSRLNLQDEIARVYQKSRLTTIMVSHDLTEIFKLSKKVLYLEKGKIAKTGTPQEVFANNDLSSKFKFAAEVIDIQKDGVLNILTLNIGNQLAKVVASDEEIKGLHIGSKVIVASKALNPVIFK